MVRRMLVVLGAALLVLGLAPPAQAAQVQSISLRAFVALELSGMARVDFLLDRRTGELYVNEVNTIPGFTKISMYPKLWEATGVSYRQLIDELIALALERRRERAALCTRFEP